MVSNVAIALARITGWLLQVSWWGSGEDAEDNDLIPLRVYIATDSNLVFDHLGKKRWQPYEEYIVMPIAEKRFRGRDEGILARFYSEERLGQLPLRVKPNERDIAKASEAILKNPAFLERIPKRLNPGLPAEVAARFSFGLCAAFADALEIVKGYPAVAVIVSKYSETFAGLNLGYCHSVILHPDGEGEDSWGKQSISNIVERFGVVEFTLSEAEHKRVIETLKTNSPEQYESTYDAALDYIIKAEQI
jgi:hypothetical protein